MITRETETEWTLTELGQSEPYMRLAWTALEERLRDKAGWSETDLATLAAYGVGQSTREPLAYYVLGGIAYATKNGDIDKTKKLSIDIEDDCPDGYYIRGRLL